MLEQQLWPRIQLEQKDMLRAGWSCLRSCSNPASPATWRASAGGLCFPTSKLRFCTPSQLHVPDSPCPGEQWRAELAGGAGAGGRLGRSLRRRDGARRVRALHVCTPSQVCKCTRPTVPEPDPDRSGDQAVHLLSDELARHGDASLRALQRWRRDPGQPRRPRRAGLQGPARRPHPPPQVCTLYPFPRAGLHTARPDLISPDSDHSSPDLAAVLLSSHSAAARCCSPTLRRS